MCWSCLGDPAVQTSPAVPFFTLVIDIYGICSQGHSRLQSRLEANQGSVSRKRKEDGVGRKVKKRVREWKKEKKRERGRERKTDRIWGCELEWSLWIFAQSSLKNNTTYCNPAVPHLAVY